MKKYKKSDVPKDAELKGVVKPPETKKPTRGAEIKGATESLSVKKHDLKRGQVLERSKIKLGVLKSNLTIETFPNDIENVKQLREKIKNAPIGLLVQLEDKYPGITLAAFTTHLKGDFKLNFKNWSGDAIYNKFKAGVEITVNFLGNVDAENQLGASDMAPIAIRGITKFEGGNKNLKRTSQRRVGLKGQDKKDRGYFDSSGYIAIHTKDVIIFHDHKPVFNTEFREKDGNKLKDINQASYDKYALSKYSKEDTKFMKKSINNYTFVTRRPKVVSADILEIRKKVGSMEGLTPAQRVEKVARYLIQPGNNIRARHCGDWVDKVYEIAGITRKKGIYHNISYAFKGGDYKKNGWKDKDDPTRYDCRELGIYAKKYKLDQIKAGDHLYVNNHNKSDYAGNHSVIFLRWKNRDLKLAEVVSWYGNKPGRQKITVYDLNKYPITHISQPIQATDPSPQEDDTKKKGPDDEKYLSDASKQDMIRRGSTPFAIKMGYRKTNEEEGWYQSTRKEGRRLGKMNINDRIAELQERYRYEDALKYSAQMVGIDPKDKDKYRMFVALNDAVLRVESNYNPFNHNSRRGKVALSTAAGEYQILNSVWQEAKKYQGSKYANSFRRGGVDHRMYASLNLTATRPEYATPYQRTVVHNAYMFRGAKLRPGTYPVPQLMEKIQNSSGRVRRSYVRLYYLMWRNGHGGAAPFHRNMRKFEQTGDQKYLMPETKAEMDYYWDNNLYYTTSDGKKKPYWQRRRSRSDFNGVMRTTKIFANRFEKNLSEL